MKTPKQSPNIILLSKRQAEKLKEWLYTFDPASDWKPYIIKIPRRRIDHIHPIEIRIPKP
jgi:vacuolar-type H+-ATPase subunit F/Vma7